MDPDRVHGHNPVMTAAELTRLGDELGLDAIGAAPAGPYEETERHIRERKERGLFATMGFTTRRPEVSCHPEQLLPDARTVISAALCYYADADDPGPGKAASPATRGPTATPSCARSSTRSAAGSAATTASSSTRTTTSTARAPCAPASRSTARTRSRSRAATARGSCSARSSATRRRAVRAARCGLRLVHALHRRLPDRRARRAGHARLDPLPLVLDAGAGRDPGRLPRRARAHPSTAATSARTSARGTAASRSGARGSRRRPTPSPPSRCSTGSRPTATSWSHRYDRLYVPRNDPRWLRRNALVAAGNVGGDLERDAVATYATGADELLRDHAEWALARIDERGTP